MNGIYRMPDGVRTLCAPLPENAPHYDIIIVGGGTAGSMAAIAAGRDGRSVLVVERLNILGGQAIAGHVDGYYYGCRGGLYEQIDAEAKAYEPMGYPLTGTHAFHVELKKRVLEKQLLDAGVELVYDADLTGVLMEGNRVVGVEYATDTGLFAARAHVVIDASAEAYVCLLAGAEYQLGRKLDGKVQPFSNMRADYYPDTRRITHAYSDGGYANPVDPEQYTDAILTAAKLPFYLREDFSQKPRLVAIAHMVGMREGPLVEGDVRLHLEDVLNGTSPRERTLYVSYSNADNHGKDMAFEDPAQTDWMVACSLWGINFTVRVPVEACIPKGIDGLMMAGRMISVDHSLASCTRQQRDVQKSGEAVGFWASEAAARGVSVRDVPYEAVEKKLRRSGCLMDQNDFGMIDTRVPADKGRVFFPETVEEIERILSGTTPGMAQWVVRRMRGDQLIPIREMLKKPGEHLPIHAAMALALAGDDSGADLLLDAVVKRDPFLPNSSKKFNMIRGAAALYLLGRLAYRPALDEALSIVENWQDVMPADFKPDEFIADLEEYRFQYLSLSIVAALAIAKKYPDVRERVLDVLHRATDREDFSIHSTLKGAEQPKYQMAPMIRNAIRCLSEE